MQKKSGFAAIIGKPNAGKSTLINSLLGQKLSIVTPKAQTTRNKIFGIYSKDNIQIVFVDTPGILKPQYKLQAFMKKEIESSFAESDVILFVIDTTRQLSPDARRAEATFVSGVVKAAQPGDNLALLTARGITQQ